MQHKKAHNKSRPKHKDFGINRKDYIKMNVTNMNSPRSNSPVANQYIIKSDGNEYFQSYQTLIAMRTPQGYVISSDYNYSRTTSKYFTQWLKSWGFTGTEIDTLKKWLKKDSTKDGSVLVELCAMPLNITFVDSL